MKRKDSALRAAFATAFAIALLSLGAAPVRADPIQAAYLDSVRARHAQMHADATEAFLAHRYSAAYGRFARLADEGHVPSALIALTMIRYGRSMFGADWDATPEQVQRWSALAAEDARERAAAAE